MAITNKIESANKSDCISTDANVTAGEIPLKLGTSNTLKFLVVEDSHAVAQNIADYFLSSSPQKNQNNQNNTEKFELDFAINGHQGLALALENYYDVVILDLMLPGIDGLEVCKQIRNSSPRHIPILMLTARDTLNDKLSGFNTGADDYLTKPFALAELKARCLVLANRLKKSLPSSIKLGELTINQHKHEVIRAGQRIQLQRIPFQILLMLVEQHPNTVTRSEIWGKLWGDSATDSDAIRSHIYQLRLALDKPFETALITTVHGVGFNLNIQADS